MLHDASDASNQPRSTSDKNAPSARSKPAACNALKNWKPTGAGPADFSQDQHAVELPAAEPQSLDVRHSQSEHSDSPKTPAIRTFVMRMDRVEPVQPHAQSAACTAQDQHEPKCVMQPSLARPAPASPELAAPGMHDPSTDHDEVLSSNTQDDNAQIDPLDATINRLSASSLTNSTGELSPTMMAIKSRLIAQIIEQNPTASHTFLQGFSPRQLRTYLDHLTIAKEPRGTVIRRTTGTPAIEAYRPSA